MFEDTNTAIDVIDHHQPVELAVIPTEMTVEAFKARVEREGQMRAILKDFVKGNMREGYHFSTDLGGVKLAKPMLLQEGCRNICSLLKLFFGEPRITEQWLDGDHYRVRVHIALYNAEGHQITSGDGICSTRETKYAYRKGDRLCPECGSGAIIKGKAQYGGGWVCYTNKGGCGTKFDDKDERLTSQQLGRIDNPDKADVENTVLKMAIKRAKSAAVCDVPMVSEIFAPEGDATPKPAAQPRQQNSPSPHSSTPKASPAEVSSDSVKSAGNVQKAGELAYKLQKEHNVDFETLAMQFLPEGVGKFSELTEEQAAGAVPGLSELLNSKLAER